MDEGNAIPNVADLYNRYFQRHQSFAVSRMHNELLRETHEARQRGVPTLLARHVPLEAVPYGAKQFELIEGDDRYSGDQLIVGPSMAGVHTSSPGLSVCIRIDKDVAQEFMLGLENGSEIMTAAFFDGVIVLPTEFNSPEATCGGGVFRALPPHRQFVEWFYDHDEREELSRLVQQVANSPGMGPAEHRRWLEEETGNDPGSQFAAE
ncbi:hypothetical protein [Candidatus Poriferisodalis sp.]|uniref:hypothetical protein n=1 Tax=Candidatus Poriferisodalis sp. TaxID=3101277 RepID=UPI003B52F179